MTSTSAVVRLEVDPPAPATLELGMSPGILDGGAPRIIESREARALHSIVVTGLEPATRYSFAVRANGSPRFGAVTTAPRDDSGAPFRFLVYGDNRTDDAAHGAVVRAMASVRADFLVHTGDFVSNGGSRADWQTFFDIESPLTNERCIFSCVGNHELVDGAGVQYARYFGPTDVGIGEITPDMLNGTFRWSSARFFMVNGMVGYKTGPSRAWLEKVLAESDKEEGLVWRIVVTHHGPWSSGPHGDNALFHDAGIPRLLAAHKVDLVLAGHDHIYERGAADGMAYVVTGGGGAPTYKIAKRKPTARHVESVRHFVEASVSRAAIQIVATRPDGSTIERCALRKEQGWDCDGATDDAGSSGSNGRASPSSSGVGGTEPRSSRCGCGIVGARAAGGLLASAALSACVVLAAVRRMRRRR